jgi:hypothetical protein
MNTERVQAASEDAPTRDTAELKDILLSATSVL